MRLKSFTAKSVPAAMRKVRDQLGPDAVILSTQKDAQSGMVTITAAIEAAPDAPDIIDEAGGTLRAIDDLSEILSFHRVPAELTDRLIAEASALTTDNTSMALAAALDGALSFAPLKERGARRPLLLAGPPGAGKTATSAKLCAWGKLNGREVTLVTMDMVKAGATSQAKTYAKALHARLEQASDADDLAHILDDLPPEGLVFIDTAGANPFDAEERCRLAEAAQEVDAEIVLVLPAGGDTAESAEIALAFREAGARTMIGTKFDASRRFGGILSAADAATLALVAAGISPSIGNGLLSLNPVSLARLMLPNGAQFAPTLATGTDS